MLGENKFYTIRARSDPSDKNSAYVSTSIPLVRQRYFRLDHGVITCGVLDTDVLLVLYVVHARRHSLPRGSIVPLERKW